MPDGGLRRSFATLACVSALAFAANARAEGSGPIVVWPTLTPAGDDASPLPLHKPTSAEQAVAARAQELDATLRDAAQDLGYTLDVADPGPTNGHARDADMIERATGAHAAKTPTWVVSARLEHGAADSFVVRIVAVPPNGKELRVRVETVPGADVSVRGLVMLRDMLSPQAAAQAEAQERARARVDSSAEQGIMSPLRSPGRAVLAVNAALFGGYVAYSIQRTSGSDDPRVLFPLLALGAGVGIGGSLLISEEWDVGTGDAWFLSAGAWWGAGSGVLIANGRHVLPLSDRYAWGIGTGLAGLGLATFALTRTKMDEGDAMLAHSGGALGLFLGGVAELAYRGSTDVTPYTGGGYGAAIGLALAGALAIKVQVSPSRVLLVDLGAGLGALAGAAAASPLLLGTASEGKNRAFLAATLGGTLAGAGFAWFLTRDAWSTKGAKSADGIHGSGAWTYGAPTAGVIGESATPSGKVPAYGVGWHGTF